MLVAALACGFPFAASSYYHHDYKDPRIYDRGHDGGSVGWCAKENVAGQWLQISFMDIKRVMKVETKGRDDEYKQRVTSYNLRYTLNGVDWEWYNDKEVFEGNNTTMATPPRLTT